MTVKLLKTKDEERILKTFRRKTTHYIQGKRTLQITNDFLSENLTPEGRRITSLECEPKLPVKPELCKQRKCPSKIKTK